MNKPEGSYMKTKIIYFIFFCFTFSYISLAQFDAVMYYLNFPRTISSVGLGEQGVASKNFVDAIRFNPSNLVFAKSINMNYFKNPFYQFGTRLPLTSFTLIFDLPNVGNLGIEYLNWSLNKFIQYTPDPPYTPQFEIKPYERSFSIAYSNYLADNFAFGLQVLYSQTNYEPILKFDKILFGIGLNYITQFFQRDLLLGFSWKNFSTAIEYKVNDTRMIDSPPANMHLGTNYALQENQFYSLNFILEFSKYIVEMTQEGGKSSFRSLFTDWKDFPRDVIIHTGLAFNWKPLYIGKNFYFFQEFYLGYIANGIKLYLSDKFTHGIIGGIKFKEILLSIGYGGCWHSVQPYTYLYRILPMETFQFNLNIESNLFFKTNGEITQPDYLDGIIISTGPKYTIRIGRFKETRFYNIVINSENNIGYTIEAGFYIKRNNALVLDFTYQSIPYKYYSLYFPPISNVKNKIETLSLATSYRYHPLNFFSSFYIQAGLGIIRVNPVILFYPKYEYKSYLQLSTGFIINLFSNLTISPLVNFISNYSSVTGPPPRIGSYNQFDIALRLGYKFSYY